MAVCGFNQENFFGDLQKLNFQPISSSAAFLLGEIVGPKQDAAQPLVRFFMHHEKLVPLIRVLASHEIARIMWDLQGQFYGQIIYAV